MLILDKLFTAADNHAEDTGEDHAVGDLQDMLRAAWGLLSPAQRKAFLASAGVEGVVEAGARDEFSVEDLLAEMGAPVAASGSKKVVVIGPCSDGSIAIHTCAPEVSDEQVDNGDHLDLAKENARFNGFEDDLVAFDAEDSAAQQLIATANWLLG